MTIQDLGSIGEFIAAVATVATLVYLAVQIRANTHQVKVESIRSETSGGADATLYIANNAELADIFNRGLADLGSLSPVESVRFSMVLSIFVNGMAGTYFSDRLGVDSTFLTQTFEGLRFLRAPGGRAWWAKNKRIVQPEFAAWLENELGLATDYAPQSTAPHPTQPNHRSPTP